MNRREFFASSAMAVGGVIGIPNLVLALQRTKKDTNISIVVDTVQINQGNKNQMTAFFDDRGGSSTSGDHNEFVSKIDLDKRVIWTAKSQNNSDEVKVTKIEKKTTPGNKDLLKKAKYTGNGVVTAKVRKNYEEGEEEYNVSFTVLRNGVLTEYTIDPKLKIGT